jgi:hypothetical protein
MDTWHTNLATAIRQFAAAIRRQKPDLSNVEMGHEDLVAAARSIESGEISQGALRLYLACRDLFFGIREVERGHQMLDVINEALAHKTTVYVDTVIISGMVKRDLPTADLESMERILDAFQADNIDLRTSRLAKQELDRIPAQYRHNHVRLFRLIKLSEVEQTSYAPDDPKLQAAFTQLEARLGRTDFRHLGQAVSIRAEFFLTADEGLLGQRTLAQELGTAIVRPSELEAELRGLHVMPPREH